MSNFYAPCSGLYFPKMATTISRFPHEEVESISFPPPWIQAGAVSVLTDRDSRSGGGLSPFLALSARSGVRPCGETRRPQGWGEGTQPPYLNKAAGERPGWKKHPAEFNQPTDSLRDNDKQLCEPLTFSLFTARDAQDIILGICFSFFCPGKGVLTNG